MPGLFSSTRRLLRSIPKSERQVQPPSSIYHGRTTIVIEHRLHTEAMLINKMIVASTG
jgi:ABC-type multidrug transport system fused ATPase/permease subunit